MTRVLFISDNFPPVIGGSAVVYDQLCRRISDSVVGLSSTHDYLGTKKCGVRDYDANCGFRMARFRHLRTPSRKTKLQGLPRRLVLLFDEIRNVVALTWKVWRLCVRENISVVCIGELISLGWLAIPLRYLFGIKTILYTHGEEISQESNTMLPRWRGLFLSACHQIVAVSNFCKGQIVTRYEISPSKIQVVSNGVDLDIFSPGPCNDSLLKSSGIDKKQIVLSAGRHVRRKGFDFLISAFPGVIREIPDAHLLLAGEGPLTGELKDQVRRLGITKSVTFVGLVPREDLLTYYRCCDVFAMPNRTMPDGDTEGFGLVFLEANACGKAVISGIGGGVIEAVSDQENGLSVDASNPSLIEEAITRLLSNDLERARMGETGLVMARANGWDSKAREFRQCLSRLVAQDQIHLNDQSLQWNAMAVAKPLSNRDERRFLLTVDTEEMFDWDNTLGSDTRVGEIAGLVRFQEACSQRNIIPTYLVTYQMLKSRPVAEFLRVALKSKACDVGIHLHAWNTPPLQGDPSDFNTFQSNLPPHQERAKLRNLCSLYQSIFGVAPRIHRAGRYGIGPRTFEILAGLEIKIDLSPSSGFDFSRLGGPNFVGLENSPFWAGPTGQVLSLPVPSVRLLRGPDVLSRIYYGSCGGPRGSAVRLAPEGNPLPRLKLAADLLLSQGLRELVISIHSSTLEPGGNHYSPDANAAARIFRDLFTFVDWLMEERSVQASTPDAIHADYVP